MQSKAYSKALLLLAVSAGLLLWMGQAANIDMWLAGLSFDAQQQVFPLRNPWVTERLLHKYLKNSLNLLAIFFAILTMIGWKYPGKFWKPKFDRRIRLVILSSILVPATIGLLKRRSRSHCPWDIDQFGGTVPYYRLLEFMPDFVIAGNCFPAGHASGGLWLISLCVFWLPAEPKKAILAGVAGLAVGLTMGISQQLRGAHFLSHTLWSIWFAAALILVLYWLCIAPKREDLRK